jgi:hypothetical protein
MKERSSTRVVYSSIDVNSWMRHLPSVEAVRPCKCPGCDAPGRVIGGPVGLHGHGLRTRSLLGPLKLGDAAGEVLIRIRRYRCWLCGAVIMVLPRGVLAGLRYSAVAIALALALWSTEAKATGAVRQVVSPFNVVGYEAARRWRSLVRWAREAGPWWGWSIPQDSPRKMAQEVVRRLAARTLQATGSLVDDACAAALFIDGHRLCAKAAATPTT